MTRPLEDLPTVIAWFDDPAEGATPLLAAIGHVVWASSALEHVLLLAVVQISGEQVGSLPPAEELTRLERMPAGPRLRELRKLDIPEDLATRLDGVIERRNEIVHRLHENAEIVRALATGKNVDAAVGYVQQVALACGQVAVEVAAVVVPRLQDMLGTSISEMASGLQSIDLEAISDARSRKQLEAIRAVLDAGIDLAQIWHGSAEHREQPSQSR